MDVIKIRFDVQRNQIIDISTENGEPVRDITSLVNDSTILVSIGKAGNILKRIESRSRNHGSVSRRYHSFKVHTRHQRRRRFFLEGSVESYVERSETKSRRSNSLHIENSAEISHTNMATPPLPADENLGNSGHLHFQQWM